MSQVYKILSINNIVYVINNVRYAAAANVGCWGTSMNPLYKMIHDDLRELVDNQTYHDGETIPSEEELAAAYGVSRPTVRRAVQMLMDEGVLEKGGRRGVCVRARKIDQRFAVTLRSFDEEIHEHGLIPKTKVILARKTLATVNIANSLGIREGDAAFRLVRLRYANDTPNVLVESLIPYNRYPGIDNVDFSTASLYAFFDDKGNPPMVAKRRLELMQADSSLAALLDVKQGDPLFRFTTTTLDACDRIIEYSIAEYRSDTNAFEFDTRVP